MFASIKNTPRAVALSAFVLLYGITPAIAAENYMNSSESIPESGQATNTPVFSGGIGDDEIDYIRSVQNQYDIKLLFTAANGEYLSDLSVQIRDKQGNTVVSTVTKGPVLLVNLPVGTYSVVASQGDINREQKISLTSRGLHSYQFRFPAQNLITSENN